MQATLTISLDLELGWGRLDDPERELYFRQFENTREVVQRLVQVADSREVPMIWAVVGALCLEDSDAVIDAVSCSPPLVTRIKDGFASIPHRFLLASSMIEGLLASRHQRIASHSFSHIDFWGTRWSRGDIAQELEASREAFRRFGLEPTEFVFPRNHVAHVDLLSAAGYGTFRAEARYWYGRGETLGSKFLLQADFGLALPGRVARGPGWASGRRRYVVPFFCPSRARGIRGWIRPRWMLRKAQSSLAAALRSGGHLDLWFHPHDFAHMSDEHLHAFEAFLDLACDRRASDRLEIGPLRRCRGTEAG